MTVIAFLDTETTSLRPDRQAWEIALILRDPDEPGDTEHHWFIDINDLDLANADPMSLKIGGFHDRHPQVAFGSTDETAVREAHAADDIAALTRGAHIIGGVPNFDTEVLAAMLRRHNRCPAWHYHLVDFENLIVGFLRGRYANSEEVPDGWPFLPPWKSDDLSRAIGVEPPGDADRHTALGDARWAARVWDAVIGTRTSA